MQTILSSSSTTLSSPFLHSVQGHCPSMYVYSMFQMNWWVPFCYSRQSGIKIFHLINSPLTDCPQPLSQRRNVASLAIFYRYFQTNCFSDLANCMLPFLLLFRYNRSLSQSYSVHLSNARANQGFESFIPFSKTPSFSVFSSFSNLNSFKRTVSKHLLHTFESCLGPFQHKKVKKVGKEDL